MTYRPLADEIRPQTLDEVVGQRHILGENGLLRRIIDSGSGSAFFMDRSGFDARIREASIVLTGDGYPEGAHRAAVEEIRRRCAQENVPAVVLEGEDPPPGTADEALERLRGRAARIFRLLEAGGRLQHR